MKDSHQKVQKNINTSCGGTLCGINKLIQTTAFSQEKVVDELLHWKGCQERGVAKSPDRYDRFKGSTGPVPFKVVDGQDIVILRDRRGCKSK